MKRDTKLLIVEDELVSAKVIERILRNKGYVNIKTVSDGLAAINEVDLSQPDLILMDIDLGNGIDGIETADKILAKFDIPIIYLTAYTTDALTERAKITGAFSYLTKPVNSETLVTNIELSLKKNTDTTGG